MGLWKTGTFQERSGDTQPLYETAAPTPFTESTNIKWIVYFYAPKGHIL